MFIFKTIALPHIFRKEKYTKRGRKYYHKRPKSFFDFILKTAAFFWAMSVLAGVAAKTIHYENNFADNFEIEEGAYAEDILNEEKIKSINFENKEINDEPLILIFQTHSNEEYADGKTVKDAGCELAKIFSEKYGITVVHDMGEYDKENGEIKREESYKRSGEGVKKLLEKYPSVKIAVDIHRDAYKEGDKAEEEDGKKYALLMPVVGACALKENGEKKDAGAENEFIYENLKFAYDFRKNCGEEGVCKKIYIKPYRYSTYMLPESILLECGNEKSTFEEVENSLYIAAEAIVKTAEISG